MRATNTNPVMRATYFSSFEIYLSFYLALSATYLALSATYLVLSRSLAEFYYYLSRFETPRKWDGGSIIYQF